MIKFDILNRWTGAAQFTAEIDCAEDATSRIKIGLAVRWARLRGADLRGAVLRDAGAIFAGADDRGYEFYLTAGKEPGDIVVRAGCRRWVTFADARAHFTQRYESNGNVPEILAKLALLESVAKARGYLAEVQKDAA